MWRFEDPLPSLATGTVSFSVIVDNPYVGDPVILNTVGVSVGDSPPALEASAAIVVFGANSIGDTIFLDDGAGGGVPNDGIRNAGESVISGIDVQLWWDRDADGLLSAADLQIAATTSAADLSGCSSIGNYCFDNIADGNFIVIVDNTDTDIPIGHRLTTPVAGSPSNTVIVTGLTGGATFDTADFGFGPALTVNKTLTSADPALAADLVTYQIAITNNRPAADSCEFLTWGEDFDAANTAATNPGNTVGSQGPDDIYGTLGEGGGGDELRVIDFNPGPYPGNITKVEVLARLFLENTLTDDDLDIFVNDGTSSSTTDTLSAAFLNANALNKWFLYTRDITGDPDAWLLAEFASSYVDFNYKHVGASDNAPIRFDAIGFRVTTDATCGAPEDDMSLVPLQDTFPSTLLSFVSATDCGTGLSGAPPMCGDVDDVIDDPDSQVPAGTLTWTDVGPLLAGRTTVYSLTFLALDPPDIDADLEPDPATIVNTALVSGATFIDDVAVNDASDDASSQLIPTGSIGDLIFNDNGGLTGAGTGGDGIQNGDEIGLPDIAVTLYDCGINLTCEGGGGDDVFVATQTTDASGAYLFDILLDGIYQVVVNTTSLPGSTFTQTGDPDEVGACATCDNQGQAQLALNDGDPTTDNDTTIDFGYQVPNTLYGSVAEDVDGDGTLEAGENGIANVTVFLDNCGPDTICGNADDLATISTTTAADGSFTFSDLTDGFYRTRVDTTTLPGITWAQTIDPDGVLDSTSADINVFGGNVFGPFDYAYTQTGASIIGDTVYADWNGDGSQDLGEEGIANITISLYEDANGDGLIDPLTDALVATTSTDANGVYTFANLPATAGSEAWLVIVDESDANWPYTPRKLKIPNEAGICTICSGSATVVTDGINPNLDIDFGYLPVGTASIGDYVWVDSDGDGLQDLAEIGLANMTVTLYEDTNGDGLITAGQDAVIAIIATDGDGGYHFYNLPAGDYLVDIDSNDPQIPIDAFGDAFVLSTGTDPYDVPLTDGQNFEDADFGFAPGGRIGDIVYQDNNGNGDFDPSEPGLNNVLVSLYNDVNGNGLFDLGTDTLVGSQSTANDAIYGDGYYLFTGLTPGNYVVVVDAADTDIPTGSVITGDPDAALDGQTEVILTANAAALYADFGFRPPGNLGGTLWIDINGDGIFDASEQALAFVTIELSDGVCTSGVNCPTTTTDSGGSYSFGNLADGSYTIIVDPSGTSLSGTLNQTLDPDEAPPATCVTCDGQGNATIAGGNSVLNVDFAYIEGPALVIDKDTLTPTVSPGGTATYTITVRNVGGAPVLGATITDITLPGNADPSCLAPGCFTLATTDSIVISAGVVNTLAINPTAGTNNLTWGTWNIPVDGSVTVTFTVNVAATTPAAVYDNPAGATATNIPTSPIDDNPTTGQDADTPDGQDPEDDEDVTVVALPAISVTKTTDSGGDSDGFVVPGDIITYNMTLTNAVGAATANDISISDTVPTGTSYVPGSSLIITIPVSALNTYADNFDDGLGGTDYTTGDDGSLNFAAGWTADGGAAVTDLGDYSLEIDKSRRSATGRSDCRRGGFGRNAPVIPPLRV